MLRAAENVFAAEGTGASTEEVAKAAGVGIGTVFRHFPTKEALLKAVFLERLHKFVAEVARWAEADDPGSAFYAFLDRWVDMGTAKNAYSDALAAAGAAVPRLGDEVGQRVRDALRTLLTRAQAAGTVREDVEVPELIALLVGASRALDYVGEDAASRCRTVRIIFDGLRSTRGKSAGYGE